MRRNKMLVRAALGAVAVGALILTSACASGSGGEDGGTADGELRKITICTGGQPDYGPLFVAKELGMWEEDYGLDVTLEMCPSTPLAIAAILNQEMAASNASVTGVTTAIGQGIPVKVLFPTSYQPREGNTGVLVPTDSDIQTFADMEGKTLGTIVVQGLFHLGLADAMQIEGADPTKLKVVAAAATDLQALLESGKVDAIMVQDANFTQIKQAMGDKVRDIGNPFGVVPWGKDLVIGSVIVSDVQLKQDPELYRTLREGWAKAVKLTEENPDVLMKLLPEITGLDTTLLKQITWGKPAIELPEESTMTMLAAMLKHGFVKAVPKFDQIYWDGK
jgi:NitT/TauT family transport system substrate-binding protein